MEEQSENQSAGRAATGPAARDNEENELEAEQESAEAMDAEVPQPAGADETTEGQPS